MYFFSIASFDEAQEHFTPTEFPVFGLAVFYKHFIPTGLLRRLQKLMIYARSERH